MQSLPPIIFTRFSGNDDDDDDDDHDDDDVCLCLSPRPAGINRRLAGHSIVDDYLCALSRCAVCLLARRSVWCDQGWCQCQSACPSVLRVPEQEEAGARCQTK